MRRTIFAVSLILTMGAPLALGDELPGLRKAYREAEDPEERKARLREIALLPADAKGVPSREAGKALAMGLEDPEMSVRVEALRLLGLAAHREVALLACIEVLDRTREELAKLSQAARRGTPNRDHDEVEEEIATTVQFVREVIVALGKLPDDRAVETLAEFSEKIAPTWRGRLAEALAQSLLQLGSRDAWQATVRMMPEFEARLGRGGAVPQRKNQKHPLRKIHEALEAAAVAAELEEVPAFSETPSAAWRRWLERQRRGLPARLGRIDPAPPDDA